MMMRILDQFTTNVRRMRTKCFCLLLCCLSSSLLSLIRPAAAQLHATAMNITLVEPTGMHVDSLTQQFMIVTQSDESMLALLDPTLSFVQVVYLNSTVLKYPFDFAVDNDTIFVSDNGNRRVVRYDRHSDNYTIFSADTLDPPSLWPTGICFDASGNVLVGDYENLRVLLFSYQGDYIRTVINSTQLVVPQIDASFLSGVAVDSFGSIFIITIDDSFSISSLLKIDPISGMVVKIIANNLAYSSLIAIDHTNNNQMAITITNHGEVYEYNNEYQLINTFPYVSFPMPVGILYCNQHLWISNFLSGTILKLNYDILNFTVKTSFAPWEARSELQVFQIQANATLATAFGSVNVSTNTLVMIGGVTSASDLAISSCNDGWVSTDGMSWTLVSGASQTANLNVTSSLPVDFSPASSLCQSGINLFMLGGTLNSSSTSTDDSAQWSTLVSTFAARSYALCLSDPVSGAISLIGGSYISNQVATNDVWQLSPPFNSTRWMQVCGAAPWSARDGMFGASYFSTALNVTLMFMVGGKNYTSVSCCSGSNDVFVSSDLGGSWRSITTAAAFPSRGLARMTATKEGILILSEGYNYQQLLNESFPHDLWISFDSETWGICGNVFTLPFSPRCLQGLVVDQSGRLFIVAGAGFDANGAVNYNDVWEANTLFNAANVYELASLCGLSVPLAGLGLQRFPDCPAGTFCVVGKSPIGCVAGTYNSLLNQNSSQSCLACPVAYYCPQSCTNPISCVEGFTSSLNSTSINDCYNASNPRLPSSSAPSFFSSTSSLYSSAAASGFPSSSASSSPSSSTNSLSSSASSSPSSSTSSLSSSASSSPSSSTSSLSSSASASTFPSSSTVPSSSSSSSRNHLSSSSLSLIFTSGYSSSTGNLATLSTIANFSISSLISSSLPIAPSNSSSSSGTALSNSTISSFTGSSSSPAYSSSSSSSRTISSPWGSTATTTTSSTSNSVYLSSSLSSVLSSFTSITSSLFPLSNLTNFVPTNNNSTTNNPTAVSVGLIVGVVAGFFVLCLICCLMFLMVSKKRLRVSKANPPKGEQISMTNLCVVPTSSNNNAHPLLLQNPSSLVSQPPMTDQVVMVNVQPPPFHADTVFTASSNNAFMNTADSAVRVYLTSPVRPENDESVHYLVQDLDSTGSLVKVSGTASDATKTSTYSNTESANMMNTHFNITSRSCTSSLGTTGSSTQPVWSHSLYNYNLTEKS